VKKTAKYTLFDHKRSQDILKELERQAVLVQIIRCKNKWIQHVSTGVYSGERGAAGLQRPQTSQNRNIKNRFCRYYDIKRFT
jgi:hypothetical protein